MKKILITVMFASALSLPLVAHAGSASVYGRLHMTYGQVTEESGGTTNVDNWQLRSHSSRLGVKGVRDFGNGLSGIYKIEYGINPDSDNKKQWELMTIPMGGQPVLVAVTSMWA